MVSGVFPAVDDDDDDEDEEVHVNGSFLNGQSNASQCFFNFYGDSCTTKYKDFGSWV